MNQKIPPDYNLKRAQAAMEELERREWWTLASALLLIVVLSGAVWAVSPVASRNLAITGLIPLVSIFVLFVIHQQRSVAELRKAVATQIGVSATLEALRSPAPKAHIAPENRRKTERHYLDQRITVFFGGQTIHGRTRDISESGVGAVIPTSLKLLDKVRVEFRTGDSGWKVGVDAIVRHQSGFYHGLEFTELSSADRDAVELACRGPVLGDVRANT